jgi:hypothetical protein
MSRSKSSVLCSVVMGDKEVYQSWLLGIPVESSGKPKS